MDPNKEKREKRAALLKRAKELLDKADEEKRSLNEEEATEYKAALLESDAIREDIEQHEELERRMIDEKMKERKERIPEGDGGFRSLGEFMYAVRFRPSDPRLVPDEKREDTDLGGQSVSDTDKGGFLVPTQYATTILQVSPQEAIVRPRATVIPADPSMPDATLKMPAVNYSDNMYGGVEVQWIDEQETKPATDFTLDQISLTPKEVAGHIPVSDQLLRNSAAAGVLLQNLLRGALVAAEDTAFLRNVGSPTSIIGHAATVQVPRASSGDVTYADLCEMYGSFLGQNGVFVVSSTTIPRFMQMEDTEGHLVWQSNAAAGVPGTILGMPVLKNQRSPALGSEGDVMLADFAYYLIKDGFGIAVAMSEHVYFTRNTTVVKAFKLVDGSPWLSSTLTLEDGVTEASPFVVLDNIVSS